MAGIEVKLVREVSETLAPGPDRDVAAWATVHAVVFPCRHRPVIPVDPHKDGHGHPPSHHSRPVAARNSTIRIPITT
jgi:hypothetical protein